MTNSELARALARSFIKRAEALGYKGKKRDDAALDYFCGAAVLASESGNASLATHLGALCALTISVYGFVAVSQLATRD